MSLDGLTLYRLTVEQALELSQETALRCLPENELRVAIMAIDMACSFYDPERVGEWEDEFGAHHEHMRGVVHHVEQLRALIAIREPLMNTIDLDWAALHQNLDILSRSARAEQEAMTPRRHRRGRPPAEWRDKVISVVASVCPESTDPGDLDLLDLVKRVLGYVGREVRDPVSAVRGALQRCPEPPFRVHPKK